MTAEKLKLKLSRISQFHMKTRIYLKYFVNDCEDEFYSFYNLP